MKAALKKLLCDYLGWHNYIPSLTWPPTPNDEPVMSMVEDNVCARCGKKDRYIVWRWDTGKQDFHSVERGWLMDNPPRNL